MTRARRNRRAPAGVGEVRVRDPRAAAEAIAGILATDGIALHRGPLDRDEAFAIAAAIGDVFHQQSIHLEPGRGVYVREPAPVPFHTDHARANVVAWLCEVPATTYNRYLDARRVFAALPPAQRTALARVRCYCPTGKPGAAEARHAIEPRVVAVRDGIARFFWVPQLGAAREPARGVRPFVRAPRDRRTARALLAFRAAVDVAPERAHVSVRLRRGEAIFIDNNRFMHGRGEVAATSLRRLFRLWINTDGWDYARRRRLRAPLPVA
jgi:alpha-ketoglutarate-dependent taurine dioxygenase